MKGLAVDLFAGGGGASTGVQAALGRPIDIAINHDRIALAVHEANHPKTRHLVSDIWHVKPLDATGGRPVGLLWASPDCRDFSVAKGGKPKNKRVRMLAWKVLRWLTDVGPAICVLENVREFEGWGPLDRHGKRIPSRIGQTFRRWKSGIEALGYHVEHRVLDASLYGAPTRRKRFFLIARRDGQPITWPEPTHGLGRLPLHTAAECIDWSIPVRSIFGRKKPLAEKTLWRIAEGVRREVIEKQRPFIVKVNHGKRDPRVESLDDPMTTVTASQRGHALVVPTLVQTGYGERKGQRPRALDVHAPLGTVVGCGQKHALVAAFLVKHFGDPRRSDGGGGVVIGGPLDEPIGTVTTRDHHSLAAVTLAVFRGTSKSHPGCAPIDAPMPTISSGGGKGGVHVAEVVAFLAKYANAANENGQLDLPIEARRRLGIVLIDGVEYQIVDIGLRMLEPHELLRAQCGRFAKTYDLSDARTKKDKIRLIGNMVCPEIAEAIVAANVPRDQARAA